MKIIGTKAEFLELLQDRLKNKQAIRKDYPKRSKQYAYLNGMIEGITTTMLLIEQWTIQKPKEEV